MPRSPDSAWESPAFALRRALGRPTIDPAAFRRRLAPEAAARVAAGAAAARRGPATAPALRCAFLAAPTPRSGTNYVEALIAAHPAVAAAPLGLREAPALLEAGRLGPFAAALAARHPSNGALGAEDWLALALAGLLWRCAAERPGAEIALLKDPHMRGLDLLAAVLPDATPILVLRDGRRTVDSAATTWPARGLRRWLGRSFADLCREWALGTDAALDMVRDEPGVLALRFEDAVAAPGPCAARLWTALGLEADAEAEAAATCVPVLGSSTHSRGADGVDWRPRPRRADFDPVGRQPAWSARQERIFRREAGATQARLDREMPIAGLAAPRSADVEAAA